MGFWNVFTRKASDVELTSGASERFDAIGADSIPPSFFGLNSYSDPIGAAPRIDRRSAIQVPAVKRSRDLIAGTLGTLPIELFNASGQLSASALLDQPEAGVPRSVTMTRTFEDLLFEGVAWWLVTETNWAGYPSKVRRLDPSTVTVKQDGKVWYTKAGNSGMTWEYAPDFDIIRFDSPNDPLLVAGARAIRAALKLDAAAERYAGGNQPLDFFTPADGEDPSQEEVDAAMDAWDVARAQRTTAYVPGRLNYVSAGWNPEQLQLATARDHAVKEIAVLAGIDPEDVGVSTTSRTYQNSQDRQSSRIRDTLAAFALAIEGRLKMNDVSPNGYYAKVNFSEFLRADDATRMTVATAGKSSGVFTQAEARSYYDPALPVSPDMGSEQPTPSEDQQVKADA